MMWNMLATAALAALVPAVAAETKPDDPKAVAVEKEFRELLKLDAMVESCSMYVLCGFVWHALLLYLFGGPRPL